MKYKKIEVGPYNLHIIKTDKFKCNKFSVQFKEPLVKENITKRKLLKEILITSTKKYNTERLMNIKSEELYGLPYGASTYISGNFHIMAFDMEFLNDKYIDESILDGCLNFMMDILFNPNTNNNKFDEKTFELAKETLKKKIESANDNPRNYSVRRMLEELGPNSIISYHNTGYIEDLEEITNENLYDFYKDVLKSNIIDIFVIGDFDIDAMKNYMASHFEVNTIKKPLGQHFVNHDVFRKRCKSIVEQKDINQSKLVIGCKLKNLTPFERNYVANIYSYILGGGADSILFRNVREKHSLCYYVSSSVYKVTNLLVIESGIDKKDYKKCVGLIKKEIKNMALGNFDESLLENGKTTYLNACKEIVDSPVMLLNVYISNEYLKTGLIDEKEKEILKVTKKDIIEFAKKVYIDTVYLLEGSDTNDD